jgi:hypothetical protein
MSYKNFFDTINSYYNSVNTDIQKKITNLNNKKNYEYIFSKKSDTHTVEVYLDNKLILKGEYCILGLYNIQLSVWYWSWNIAFINKKLIELPINKIKNFIGEINDNYKKFNNEEAELMHYLLSNDNFYISSKHIEKLVKLSLYLTKSIWYFPIKQTNNNTDNDTTDDSNDYINNDYINNDSPNTVQYIMITKILQY